MHQLLKPLLPAMSNVFPEGQILLTEQVEAFNFNQDSKIKVYSTGLVAHKQIKSKSAGKTDNNKKSTICWSTSYKSISKLYFTQANYSL